MRTPEEALAELDKYVTKLYEDKNVTEGALDKFIIEPIKARAAQAAVKATRTDEAIPAKPAIVGRPGITFRQHIDKRRRQVCEHPDSTQVFDKAKESIESCVLTMWAKGFITPMPKGEQIERAARKAESLASMLTSKGNEEAAARQLERAKAIREGKTLDVPLREAPSRPSKGACVCGCSGTTKGGRFLPGHDARLHGALKRVLKGEALTKPVEPGALEHIREREWFTEEEIAKIVKSPIDTRLQ